MARTRTKTTGLWPIAYASWYEEPPRRRTVLVNGSPSRVSFPHMVFAVYRVMWLCVGMRVFRREDGLLRYTCVPNVGRETGVCFGSATVRVTLGLLNPVTAFWNTGFDRSPNAHSLRSGELVYDDSHPAVAFAPMIFLICIMSFLFTLVLGAVALVCYHLVA